MGCTDSAHLHPGSNTARPTVAPPILISSTRPFGNSRISSGFPKPLTSALSMRLVILSACLVCGCYRIESKLRRRPNVKDEPRDVGDVGSGETQLTQGQGANLFSFFPHRYIPPAPSATSSSRPSIPF